MYSDWLYSVHCGICVVMEIISLIFLKWQHLMYMYMYLPRSYMYMYVHVRTNVYVVHLTVKHCQNSHAVSTFVGQNESTVFDR